jgi:hypothetical protein
MLAMAGSRLYQLLTKAGERANTDLGPRRLDEKGKEGDLLPREGKTFVMHGRTLENAKGTKAETASMTTRLAVADKVKVLGGPGSTHVLVPKDVRAKEKVSTEAHRENPFLACTFKRVTVRREVIAISPTKATLLPLPQKAVAKEAKDLGRRDLERRRETERRKPETNKIFSRGGSKP